MGKLVAQRRIFPGLVAIDVRAMREAVAEFNRKGRTKFLKRYGFSRSSGVYLIYGQRLYDTKALVAAAYRYATGKTLRHTEFSGGGQTQAVFMTLHQRLSQFCRSVFNDKTEHSGGVTLRRKGYHRKRLWIAIRGFPLGYGINNAFAKSLRSAQIRHLERTLLYEYVQNIRAYPPGNSK